MLSKRFVLLLTLISNLVLGITFHVQGAVEVVCTVEEAEKKVRLFMGESKEVSFVVDSVDEVHLNFGKVKVCEVVGRFLKKGLNFQTFDQTTWKSVIYYGEDFIVLGEIRRLVNGKVELTTKDKLIIENLQFIKQVHRELTSEINLQN